MRRKSSVPKPPAKVFGRPASAGRSIKSGVRTAAFYGLFAALLGTNALTLVGFLMAPDIAALMSGQNESIFEAYEDRIAELRIEVDRLHSRQYAQAGDLNLQLQELTQQQEVLMEQHQYVKLLADKAAELGIAVADLPEDPAPPTLVTSALSVGASDPRSHVEADGTVLRDMMTESRLALAAISEEATSATNAIVKELKGVGISPALPDGTAMGGPFIPAVGDSEAPSLVDDANDVMVALSRYKAARLAVDAAPIHRPIAASVRMSSGYGNRSDPFTRRKAFHSGVDFPSPTGTTVIAAGEGKVTYAGKKSGYGNVVEITHAGGVMTRYAHLSAFLVKEGQSVSRGTPIARVGSTGRSTGPHLHFEVRIKNGAVDPTRYLAAGRRLKQLI